MAGFPHKIPLHSLQTFLESGVPVNVLGRLPQKTLGPSEIDFVDDFSVIDVDFLEVENMVVV